MPLQKPSLQGNTSTDPQLVQNRRRTLQTISELSATDGAAPDFSSFITSQKNGQVHLAQSQIVEQKPKSLSNRRSLPQYCSSPECLRVQALQTLPPVHFPALQC